MKIAMVAPLWGPAYPTGSGIYACELSKRLVQTGNEVHVYTSDTGHFNGYKYPENMSIHRLKSHGLLWEMNPLSNAFVKLVKEDFDIVHVHSYIFLMSNSAAFARVFKKFGYILNFHGGIDMAGDGGSLAPRVWLKENVYDQTLGRSTVTLADKVLSVCKKDISKIKEKFGVDAQYIPNAVCPDHFSYMDNESNVVLYVGKLERWKGAKDLLDIFSIIHRQRPETTFKVIGDGTLKEEIQSSNLPIQVMGFVPHKEMAQHYQNANLTILPSYMEGTPTTCIESLACGTPVVATNVGDTKDIVIDGQTGFLHEPMEIREMANSAINILDDRSMRRSMGLRGRQLVCSEYSYESVTYQTLKVYRDVMNELTNETLHHAIPDDHDISTVEDSNI